MTDFESARATIEAAGYVVLDPGAARQMSRALAAAIGTHGDPCPGACPAPDEFRAALRLLAPRDPKEQP